MQLASLMNTPQRQAGSQPNVARACQTKISRKSERKMVKGNKEIQNASTSLHASEYELLPELANATCGLTFRQLRLGNVVDENEMERLFSKRAALKIGVSEVVTDFGRRVFRRVLVKMYGRKEVRCWNLVPYQTCYQNNWLAD